MSLPCVLGQDTSLRVPLSTQVDKRERSWNADLTFPKRSHILVNFIFNKPAERTTIAPESVYNFGPLDYHKCSSNLMLDEKVDRTAL